MARVSWCWGLSACLVGCADDPCAAPECPVDIGKLDLSTPAVSLETDVMPVIQRSCGFSTCHGSTGAPAAGLYLAPSIQESATEEVTATFVANLVNQPSAHTTEMPLVDPGHPENSFLMLKLDGCQDALGLACTPVKEDSESDCGDAMPRTSALLCSPERDLLRRWIAQGALDN